MRAGSTATSSSSGAHGDTHPFTTKKGSSMDMASRPPAASRLLRAQGALRGPLCPPHRSAAAAGASAWGTQSCWRALAGAHGTATGPALDRPADRTPDSDAGPRACLLPRLLPARLAGLTPPPGPAASANHRRRPLHHFRTRAHVTRAGPAPRRRGLGVASRNPGGGARRRVGESWSSSHPCPLRVQGRSCLFPPGGQLGFQDMHQYLICTILLPFLYF